LSTANANTKKKVDLENETEINDVSVWHILAVLGQKGPHFVALLHQFVCLLCI